MIQQKASLGVTILTAFAAGWLSAGCEKKPVDPKAVEARLAQADAVDGKVDKVVSKCAGCALGMDGKKEHSFTTSGYVLQFCSEGCKSEFEKDPGRSVLAMKIPGE